MQFDAQVKKLPPAMVGMQFCSPPGTSSTGAAPTSRSPSQTDLQQRASSGRTELGSRSGSSFAVQLASAYVGGSSESRPSTVSGLPGASLLKKLPGVFKQAKERWSEGSELGGSQKHKVGFDEIVSDNTGDLAALKTDSPKKTMDFGWTYSAPWGYALMERIVGGRGLSLKANRFFVLFLTFMCYTAYHASRRPLSIVKSVLNGEPLGGEGALLLGDMHGGGISGSSGGKGPVEMVWTASNISSPAVEGLLNGTQGLAGEIQRTRGEGWYPFDTKKGKTLLGDLDLAFLGAYAMGMFVSGHLGDRVDLRYFLTGGMVGSGVFVCLFGLAYFLKLHSMAFFIFIQIGGGLLQATGWPSVVSVMANWFGKGKRGLIMGIWNAHTSVGNIVGSVAAATALQYGWGWSFMLPGAFIIVMGLVIFSFLVVEPSDVGFAPQSGSVMGSISGSGVQTPRSEASASEGDEAQHYLERHLARVAAGRGGGLVPEQIAEQLAHHHGIHGGHGKHGMWGMGSTLVVFDKHRRAAGGSELDGGSEAENLLGGSPGSTINFGGAREKASGVSFWTAWAIPGVAAFSLTLFFAKLVAYTFLYWLPYYINATDVGGRKLTPTEAGNLSILFDVGGVMGGVVAGALSDASGASALVSSSFVYLAIPVLYAYRAFGNASFTMNISLMMIAGFFVNGPYALITTAVSADLGTHESLAGNEKALATVTAIIDGMGSLGAALGPTLTGYISSLPGGFDNVFLMLGFSALCAGLLLTKLVIQDVKDMLRRRAKRRGAGAAAAAAADDFDRILDEDVTDSGQFSYLPPGVVAEKTVDNETGRLV
ncbi:hypothetical protein N2152v2_000243 [Parachlorella kessleri]